MNHLDLSCARYSLKLTYVAFIMPTVRRGIAIPKIGINAIMSMPCMQTLSSAPKTGRQGCTDCLLPMPP